MLLTLLDRPLFHSISFCYQNRPSLSDHPILSILWQTLPPAACFITTLSTSDRSSSVLRYFGAEKGQGSSHIAPLNLQQIWLVTSMDWPHLSPQGFPACYLGSSQVSSSEYRRKVSVAVYFAYRLAFLVLRFCHSGTRFGVRAGPPVISVSNLRMSFLVEGWSLRSRYFVDLGFDSGGP